MLHQHHVQDIRMNGEPAVEQCMTHLFHTFEALVTTQFGFYPVQQPRESCCFCMKGFLVIQNGDGVQTYWCKFICIYNHCKRFLKKLLQILCSYKQLKVCEVFMAVKMSKLIFWVVTPQGQIETFLHILSHSRLNKNVHYTYRYLTTVIHRLGLVANADLLCSKLQPL